MFMWEGSPALFLLGRSVKGGPFAEREKPEANEIS
jgi:hypothetical protein